MEIWKDIPAFPRYQALGVTRGNISRCLTGERKGQRVKGYHVEYV